MSDFGPLYLDPTALIEHMEQARAAGRDFMHVQANYPTVLEGRYVGPRRSTNDFLLYDMLHYYVDLNVDIVDVLAQIYYDGFHLNITTDGQSPLTQLERYLESYGFIGRLCPSCEERHQQLCNNCGGCTTEDDVDRSEYYCCGCDGYYASDSGSEKKPFEWRESAEAPQADAPGESSKVEAEQAPESETYVKYELATLREDAVTITGESLNIGRRANVRITYSAPDHSWYGVIGVRNDRTVFEEEVTPNSLAKGPAEEWAEGDKVIVAKDAKTHNGGEVFFGKEVIGTVEDDFGANYFISTEDPSARNRGQYVAPEFLLSADEEDDLTGYTLTASGLVKTDDVDEV